MERCPMKVLDTSVIYKWYVDEEDTPKALTLFNEFKTGRINLSIPDLVFYELANSLRYNPRNTEKDVEEVMENLSDLSLDIVIVTTGLIKNAIRLAYKYDITIYDATFAALAQDLEFEFVTADERLYKQIKKLPFVKLLREIGD
jgi:predicted nucleic acid-binding protein